MKLISEWFKFLGDLLKGDTGDVLMGGLIALCTPVVLIMLVPIYSIGAALRWIFCRK